MSPGDILPPVDAPTHRGWAVWFDPGHYEHGIVYRETKWRGRSPAGELIENPSPLPGDTIRDGYAWVKAEIDRRAA
jgi:hypothetical protein